ncbi:GroES-like protein [Periconia macrospinosa]|uniref:enoyl-[acyl-carrier-protein] reductase n=1 Tax=Periconia macrospinosa TaxID=97972 RepID=A0A2V1CWN6_9PLEO|nr:GroES-like protein [Periconia macrospinosa]
MSKSESLVFTYGTTDVVESLRLVPTSFGELGPTQVFVQFLAVPINPLDLLVLHGQYPVKPQSHVSIGASGSYPVPGSDGVARVLQMGSAVPDLQIGDEVIVRTHCQGTWRTHAQLEASHVLKVPSGLDPRYSTLLRMGVLPAFFLLQDYHPLSPGDWIILNAATGTISHFVSQIAQLYGVNVVSVIRDRSDDGERERTERSLKSHGAGVVVTESQLTTAEALAGRRIVFGIDFVSDDKLTAAMAGVLAPGATLLTAGFLGPASAPEVNLRKLLWERNITLRPFRISASIDKRSAEAQQSVINWLGGLWQRGALTSPLVNYIRWDQQDESRESTLRQAVNQAQNSPVGQRKTVVLFGSYSGGQ